MIRVVYDNSALHPSSMTISHIQENSEMEISTNIHINEIANIEFMNVILEGLQEIPANSTVEDNHGGAIYAWEFE